MEGNGTEIMMAQILTSSTSSSDILDQNTDPILPPSDPLQKTLQLNFPSMNSTSKILDLNREEEEPNLDSGKENDSNATTEEVFNEGNESLESSETDALDYNSELLYTIHRANMKPIAVSSSNAMVNFENIIRPQLAEKKEIIILLDYDGTLTPIVSDPSKALLPEKTREILGHLSQLTTVGIVSGRSLEKVQDFVGVENVFYAGSHGFDISMDCRKRKGGNYNNDLLKKESNNGSDIEKPKEVEGRKSTETTFRYQVAQDALPFLKDIKTELEKVLLYGDSAIEGANIEDNKYSVSAHYRNVKSEEEVGKLYRIVSATIARYPMLKLSTGKKVLEIKPDIMWNKGKAMKWVLEALGMLLRDDVCTIYIGDDVTDEDAFEVFSEESSEIFGLGIVVTDENKVTGAEYSLQNPSEVADFLLLISDFLTNR